MLKFLTQIQHLIVGLLLFTALFFGVKNFIKLNKNSDLKTLSTDDAFNEVKKEKYDGPLDKIVVGLRAGSPVTLGDQSNLISVILVFMKKHKIFAFFASLILALLIFIAVFLAFL